MGFHQAKEMFDDARKYLSSSKDPVMWDLVNGLSEMAKSLNALESDVSQLSSGVSNIQQSLHRISR